MNTTTNTVNVLPVPTWNHLGVNAAFAPNFPKLKNNDVFPVKFDLPPGVKKETVSFSTMADASLESYVLAHQNAGIDMCITCQNNDCLQISSHLDAKNSLLCEKWNITVEPECRAQIFHVLTSEEGSETFAAGIIKLRAQKNAVVHLTLAQLMSDTTKDWSQLIIEADEGAKVEVVRILLGSEHTLSAVKTLLTGDSSEFSMDTLYHGKSNQSIDINDIVSHYGRNTLSRMYMGGILEDKSKKIYRGTIDFHKGAVHAEGKEFEDVLLMSPHVQNRTCPLILCGEESVAGEHAATIGRFNDNQLFYLCSRGLTEEEAKQLLIHAKVDNVVRKISSEPLQEQVLSFVKKRVVKHA